MSGITLGRLLGRVLRVAGIDAVYGRPLTDVGVVAVASDRVAALMAEAHDRVHGRAAAVHRADGLVLVGRTGSRPEPVVVASVDDLLAATATIATAGRSGGLALRLDVDPAAPAPDVVPPAPPPPDHWVEPADDVVAALAAADRPVVLVGPGVVRARAVPGLHALAAAGSVGVLNTWGAKGVFDWRSRHHLATAGLQARDFELAGLGSADLIVITGLDPAEAGGERWRLAPAVEVAPGALDPLSGRWGRPRAEIAVPPLRAGLARVTQEGWASTATPLAPSLVTRHYGQVLGAGGLVAADPGTAGYWVARTYATTELGAVQVPASRGHDGFAVACATVARLRTPHRPVLAVVDGPMAGAVHGALEAAASVGVAVPVEAWHPDGDTVTADDHLARLQAIVNADRPPPIEIATDAGQLGLMVDVAGEIIAWTG